MDTPEIVKNDPYLEPFKADFNRWQEKLKVKEGEILNGKSLVGFASGHLYFGLFRTNSGWIIREWAQTRLRFF